MRQVSSASPLEREHAERHHSRGPGLEPDLMSSIGRAALERPGLHRHGRAAPRVPAARDASGRRRSLRVVVAPQHEPVPVCGRLQAENTSPSPCSHTSSSGTVRPRPDATRPPWAAGTRPPRAPPAPHAQLGGRGQRAASELQPVKAEALRLWGRDRPAGVTGAGSEVGTGQLAHGPEERDPESPSAVCSYSTNPGASTRADSPRAPPRRIAGPERSTLVSRALASRLDHGPPAHSGPNGPPAATAGPDPAAGMRTRSR